MRLVEVTNGAAHGVDVLLLSFVEEVIAGGENVLSAHAVRRLQDVPALRVDLLGRAVEQAVKTDIAARADARVKLGEGVLNALDVTDRRLGQRLKQVNTHLIVVALGQHRLNGRAHVGIDQHARAVNHIGHLLGIRNEKILIITWGDHFSPRTAKKDEIRTAELICEIGADGARVYPTVVFADTELERMTHIGSYEPLDTENAVERTKNVLDIFDRYRVPCIRVGLCASENLRDASKAIAGATHAAIGEMAMSELFYERICNELDKSGISGGSLIVYAPLGAVSKVVGQKKKNKEKICKKYSLESLKVLEKSELLGYNIILEHIV